MTESKTGAKSRPFYVISGRIRSTPFTERVAAAGVSGYSTYNHTLLPLAFRGLEDDYWHLKQHVQLWDVSCQRQVELRGPDAARLAQLMTPRDLSSVAPGRCAYAPLVDESGAMINDPVVLKLDEDWFWLSIADSDVLLWAKGLAYGMQLNVAIDDPEVAPLAVQGPCADQLMARVFGAAVNDIKFFGFERLDFHGRPLIVARSGWSKQGGFEIYLDEPSLGNALWDALWLAGQDLNVGPGCPNLIERIEGGLLSYGSDMTREHNPLECGLDQFCHLDCDFDFIGRDALRRIKADGITRRIVGLRIDTDSMSPCRSTWPVHADDRRVGQVTSAAYSPAFACGVALAMLDRDQWSAGTTVEVDTAEGRRSATVSELPFKVPNP